MDLARYLDLFLDEELGADGDITSDTLLAEDVPGQARVVVREPCVVAGVAVAEQVFACFQVDVQAHCRDGDQVDAGAVLMDLRGPARGLLSAERLALNILGRMSGIATLTRQAQDRLAAAGGSGHVAATRKTTPGFRPFEKEAVRIGGGQPHRAGLWDAAMVKDNHRAAAGDVASAVGRLQAAWPDRPITVEAESRDDALAAARAGADWVLIDNQEPDVGAAWAKEVRAAAPQVQIEASGGITPERVAAFAWADRISMGALTQAARAIDVSLEWKT